MKEQKDARLWQQAKVRAGFKIHLTTYLVVNTALWIIWFVKGGAHTYPWPVWPTVGWGIGIVSNYLTAYQFKHTAEKEYEKLKQEEH